MNTTIISAKGIEKTYGTTKALRSVNLDVRSGEIIFDNKRIDTLSDNARTRLRRQAFGFVFQFSQLVPELTALDNVALPLLLNGAKRKAAYTEARKWLAEVDLQSQANSLPGELSGGQVQRVAIARAMIAQPKILFADEPTGSLDSRNSTAVMELFIGAAKEHGTTDIMVTHESSVAEYADRTIIVRDGHITEGNS